MVGRSQARLFIIDSAEKIKELDKKGYTLKEIHKQIPMLKDNIHYATFVRNISKLNIIVVDSKNENGENQDSTINQNFVNEKTSALKDGRIPKSEEDKPKKLKAIKEAFKFDHGTNDSNLI